MNGPMLRTLIGGDLKDQTGSLPGRQALLEDDGGGE